MKVNANTTAIATPEIGVVESFSVVDGCRFLALRPIKLEEISKLYADNPKLVGLPVYFCQTPRLIHVFPKTDKKYEMVLRYFPPMVEI